MNDASQRRIDLVKSRCWEKFRFCKNVNPYRNPISGVKFDF